MTHQEDEIALLKCDVENLKSRRDIWGRRLFNLCVAAAKTMVGSLVTNYLKKP